MACPGLHRALKVVERSYQQMGLSEHFLAQLEPLCGRVLLVRLDRIIRIHFVLFALLDHILKQAQPRARCALSAFTQLTHRQAAHLSRHVPSALLAMQGL